MTIDFGNGRTVKRTLQGNIATYVCNPQGIVFDVLPGIYNPTVYRQALELCKGEYSGGSNNKLEQELREYHTRKANELRNVVVTPQMQAIAPVSEGFLGGGGGFKGGAIGFAGGTGFGGGMKGALGHLGGIEGPTAQLVAGVPPTVTERLPTGPLAAHPGLQVDAEANERIRRRIVHERLASAGLVHPNEIKSWLFKEVLHCDLDDPLLGLGEVLNANYPFRSEDELDLQGRGSDAPS
ncbi:MAG: hypothetical protein ACJ8C4_08110 [Gemmataceae bacterium]